MIGGGGGWFKESTRHSLAARGIPSSYMKRKDGYFRTLTEFWLSNRASSQRARAAGIDRSAGRIIEEKAVLQRGLTGITDEERKELVKKELKKLNEFERAAVGKSPIGAEQAAKEEVFREIEGLGIDRRELYGDNVAQNIAQKAFDGRLDPSRLDMLADKFLRQGVPNQNAKNIVRAAELVRQGPKVRRPRAEKKEDAPKQEGETRKEAPRSEAPKKQEGEVFSTEDREYMSKLSAPELTAYMNMAPEDRAVVRGEQ